MPAQAGSFLVAALILVAAAGLEVGGDAAIRTGLRGGSRWWVVVGCAVLAGYGLVVNRLPWDFARLLGTYVAVFAVVAVVVGWWQFGESISLATWCGLGLIVAGGVVLQWGAG